ncbi:hypothetical protein ACFX12_003565 [Malus domestica]
MKIFQKCFWLCVLFVSFCYAEQTVEVLGVGECTDCDQNSIKTSRAFSGLRVTIDCKPENGHFKTRGVGELNEHGEFKVSLPKEILKEENQLKEDCYAQLHSASAVPCAAHDGLKSTKIVFKSKASDGTQTFGVVGGKLKFSPVTCTSAFFWPHKKHPLFSKLPHLPKLPTFPKSHPILGHPFPFPPKVFPPFPPKVFPPKVPIFKKPLPPPVPIYKKPLPPHIPVYKKPLPPPIPVYKKPLPPPIPVYKKPLPPPVPVYKKPLPPPVPIYKKPLPPLVPVYKKPLPPPIPIYTKPFPPPVPFFKPKPHPFFKPKPKPHPFFKPHPPLPKIPHPFFKPLPPLPKIPHPFFKKPPIPPLHPKYYFPHPKDGKFPPMSPLVPQYP